MLDNYVSAVCMHTCHGRNTLCCMSGELLTHLSLRVVGQKICSLLQSSVVVVSPHLQLLNSILRKPTLTFQQKFTHPALDHAAEVLQLDNLGSGRRANRQPCFSLSSSQRDSLSVSDSKRSRLTTEHRVNIYQHILYITLWFTWNAALPCAF